MPFQDHIEYATHATLQAKTLQNGVYFQCKRACVALPGNTCKCSLAPPKVFNGTRTLSSMTSWKSGAAPAGMRVKKFSTRFSTL